MPLGPLDGMIPFLWSALVYFLFPYISGFQDALSLYIYLWFALDDYLFEGYTF